MATKYDTNPLDPDFPEKAKAAAAGLETQNLQDAGTQAFPYVAPTEEQTRRFAQPEMHGYQNPYTGQYVPAQYQAAGFAGVDQSITRKVTKIGIPENIATALPYIPWYFGMVAGVLMLFFVPRSETKVRFHAAQALAAHIAILVVSTLLGALAQATDFARFGNGLFNVVAMIMLLIWTYKAYKGRPVHIEWVDDLTNWLDEKINPKP